MRTQVHIPVKESDGSVHLFHASVCHKVWLHLGQELKRGCLRPTLSAGTWIGPTFISAAGVPNKDLEFSSSINECLNSDLYWFFLKKNFFLLIRKGKVPVTFS